MPFHFKQWGHWVPAELTSETEAKFVALENERPVKMVRLSKKRRVEHSKGQPEMACPTQRFHRLPGMR